MRVENPYFGKVYSLDQIVADVSKEKSSGKKVGLITGCFDILHVGHLDLFRKAKEHVDILVVGVERDESLKSKSSDRPINNLDWRCDILSELRSVDLVFPIEFVIEYKTSSENDSLYRAMYKRINPDFLITTKTADNYWSLKELRAKEIGIGFIGLELEKISSTTEVLKKIQENI